MESVNNILEFHDVTGRNKRFNLRDVSFAVEPGYIYGLMGENGAGKTTLMKYIIDDKLKYDGEILVNGTEVRGNHDKVMDLIGYVSEDHVFFEDRTGMQNAQLLGPFFEQFDMNILLQCAKSMNLSLHTTYKKMSRGEKLKFQLAFVAAYKPVLYMLDEVTVGMDPVFRIEFFDMLRELIKDESCSVLMTSHIQSEIEIKTDYVAVMKDGCLSEFSESMEFSGMLNKED